MIHEHELWALFSLLDDSQPGVHDAVRARLRFHGESAIGPLREMMEANNGMNADEVKEIVDVIRFEHAVRRIGSLDFTQARGTALEDAVFLVAKYGHPEAQEAAYRQRLDEMSQDIRILAGLHATSLELTMRLRSYLFTDLGFSGNRDDYYHPDNSFMNKVIDLRRGIPITLSVLMLLLGRRLHLPLYGIGMPMHFLVQFDDGSRSFYIDAFNEGAIITRDQCKQMLASSGITLTHSMLEPVSEQAIVERMIRNLFVAYRQSGNSFETQRVGALLAELNPDYKVNSLENEDEFGDEEDDL